MTGLMCLLDLYLGVGGGLGVIAIACTFLRGLQKGSSNVEKWGDH